MIAVPTPRRPVPARCHTAAASVPATSHGQGRRGLDHGRTGPSPRRGLSPVPRCRAQVGNAERRKSVLLGAKQVARAAHVKVQLCQLEAIAGGNELLQPLATRVRKFFVHHHRTVAGMRAATHPSAKLVELRKAKPLGGGDRSSATHWGRRRPLRSPWWPRAPGFRRGGNAPSRRPSRRASCGHAKCQRESRPARRW